MTNEMAKKDMDNLMKINSAFGRSLILLNNEFDEEDASFLEKIMTTKVKDTPKMLEELFTELLRGMSEEFGNMEIGDVLSLFIDGETYDTFEDFDE